MILDTFLNKRCPTAKEKDLPTSIHSVELDISTYSLSYPPINMSSTIPFNIFMEKKKHRSGGTSTTDELALVKAAAWAWYQHGSGSEGKPVSEFDVTRTHEAPKPSRYKLEAMRLMEAYAIEGSQASSSPIRTDNSLLDAYEIESISKQLEDLIESSSRRFYSRFYDNDPNRPKHVSLVHDHRSGGGTSPLKHKTKKFLKRFWLGQAVVCGTSKDVDTRAFVHSRRPERDHVPVIRTDTCRPRAAHS